MSNVIKLFVPKNVEIAPSEPEALIAAAVSNVSALAEHLSHKLNELSKDFDSIENAIETIEDIGTRTRLCESIKLSRESLLNAMLKLSRQIGTLVGCCGASVRS
jgi:hypothetical protein